MIGSLIQSRSDFQFQYQFITVQRALSHMILCMDDQMMSWDPVLLRKYSSTGHFRLLNQLKNDLENLGFKHLYPQQHRVISEQLAEREEKHQVILSEQLLVCGRARELCGHVAAGLSG